MFLLFYMFKLLTTDDVHVAPTSPPLVGMRLANAVLSRDVFQPIKITVTPSVAMDTSVPTDQRLFPFSGN